MAALKKGFNAITWVLFAVSLQVGVFADSPPELPTSIYGTVYDTGYRPLGGVLVDVSWTGNLGESHKSRTSTMTGTEANLLGDESLEGIYFFNRGEVKAAPGTIIRISIPGDQGILQETSVASLPGGAAIRAPVLIVDSSAASMSEASQGAAKAGTASQAGYTGDSQAASSCLLQNSCQGTGYAANASAGISNAGNQSQDSSGKYDNKGTMNNGRNIGSDASNNDSNNISSSATSNNSSKRNENRNKNWSISNYSSAGRANSSNSGNSTSSSPNTSTNNNISSTINQSFNSARNGSNNSNDNSKSPAGKSSDATENFSRFRHFGSDTGKGEIGFVGSAIVACILLLIVSSSAGIFGAASKVLTAIEEKKSVAEFLSLPVSEIMTENIYYIDAGKGLLETMQLMHDKELGSVVVTSHGKLFGTLSESDVLKLLSRQASDAVPSRLGSLASIKLSDAVNTKCLTTSPETGMLTLAMSMKAAGARRAVILNKGDVQGIVAMSDLLRKASGMIRNNALQSILSGSKLLGIATVARDAAFIEKDASVRDAVLTMDRCKCSQVFLRGEGDSAMIFTTNDLLKLCLANKDAPISEVLTLPAKEHASSPVICTGRNMDIVEGIAECLRKGCKRQVISRSGRITSVASSDEMLIRLFEELAKAVQMRQKLF